MLVLAAADGVESSERDGGVTRKEVGRRGEGDEEGSEENGGAHFC